MVNKIIIAIMVGVILLSGCVSSPSIPEDTLNEQVIYNKYIQGNELYDLLSNDLKAKNTADNLQTKLNVYSQVGQITDHNILNESINGNTATYTVEVIWLIGGTVQRTKTYTMTFVLENEEWKISSNPILKM